MHLGRSGSDLWTPLSCTHRHSPLSREAGHCCPPSDPTVHGTRALLGGWGFCSRVPQPQRWLVRSQPLPSSPGLKTSALGPCPKEGGMELCPWLSPPSPVSPCRARGPGWGTGPRRRHKWRWCPQQGSRWGLAEEVRGSWGRSGRRWRCQAAIEQGMSWLQAVETGSSHGPRARQLFPCLIEAGWPGKARGARQPGGL